MFCWSETNFWFTQQLLGLSLFMNLVHFKRNGTNLTFYGWCLLGMRVKGFISHGSWKKKGRSHKWSESVIIEHLLWFQVNFQEDNLRTEGNDKGDIKYKGAMKPLTTFKGHLLDVRLVISLTPSIRQPLSSRSGMCQANITHLLTVKSVTGVLWSGLPRCVTQPFTD